MTIYCKTAEELEMIRNSSLIVSNVLATLALEIKPGIPTIKLDQMAEELILSHKAKPAFKGYKGFPYTLCISLNEAVVHGFPSERELVEGDIISIDCGVECNGFFGDSAYTFALGEPRSEVKKLLQVTKQSLHLAIKQATVGKRIGDISYAIQAYCEYQHGFGVVREMVGHGIGASLHEEPEVPNHGKRGKGTKLLHGMVIAIEPMVNQGTEDIEILSDGWTCLTKDRLPSAHYEHTVAIDKIPNVLSSFVDIETNEIKNINLYNCHS